MKYRICYACGSNKTKTHHSINGSRTQIVHYPCWYLNRPTNLVICRNCYKNIFSNKKRITFKRDGIFQRVHLTKIVRSGKCFKCGKIRKTHLHHEKYNDEDVIDGTVELCIPCHTARRWQLYRLHKSSHSSNDPKIIR